jgi:hemerythrin-like domain-containing protein
MFATDELRTEHRAIERMLAILEAAAQRIERGEGVRPDLFHQGVDFVRNFADRCHHAKEEENLFPRMEARGVPRDGGPIGVMLFEHEEGRAYIRAIAGAIEAYGRGVDGSGVARTIAKNVHGYVDLLRHHIMKEDNVLFPMADRVLSAADQAELERRFEQIETERIGPDVHERYHRLLDELEEELGLVASHTVG